MRRAADRCKVSMRATIRQTGQCFLIYSFLGWVLEGLYHLRMKGTFRKPNFLYGPLKPMYGFAGVLLNSSHKYDRRHFAYHCCVLPLLVEYISAWWLERRYALKYWDYSGEPLQFGGKICLKFAFYWMILAQLVVRVVQPMLNLLCRITGRLSAWKLLTRVFFADCAATMYRRRIQYLKEIQSGVHKTEQLQKELL